MKKPIDPNLLSGDDDILSGLIDGEVSVPEEEKAKPAEPEFILTEKIPRSQPKPADAEAAGVEMANAEAKAAGGEAADTEAKATAGSEHHHSSSGSHHHSSSGSHHHSSSSSHHHSSSGSHHHSSSGSHHHSSSSSHHHSSGKKESKLPLPARIAIGILLALLLLVLIVVGTFFALRYLGKKDVMPTVQEPAYQEIIDYNGHRYKFNEDMIALGFLGVDREQFQDAANGEYAGASDLDVVIGVDSRTGKTSAIAIPRDTMVDVNVTTSAGVFVRTQPAQLCLSYTYGDGRDGSCRNTVDAMSRVLLNMPIEKYFALDIDGIAALNDAIGGVTVESLYDFPEYGISEGDTVTLHGETAEMYVRKRDMDKADASLRRLDRQIQYVRAYAAQVLPAVIRDFSTVSRLYNTALDYSQTNISLNNTTYLASLLLSKGVTDFETYKLEGEVTTSPAPLLEGVVYAEFYPDEDSVMQTVLDVFYTQID